MRSSSVRLRLTTIASSALALGLVSTGTNAQTAMPAHPPAATKMPATSPAQESGAPSIAQLQKEIAALRAEVRQLRQARQGAAAQAAPVAKSKGPAGAKPAMKMGMEPCDRMKSGGMAMHGKGMPMDKKDGCMAMPPTDAPDTMKDMEDMDDM